MTSLRLRLLLAAIGGVSLAMLIAGIVIISAFSNHVRQRYIKELDDHLVQLAALLVPQPGNTVSLSGDLSDPQFKRPLSGLYWQISEHGRVVLRSRSLWDEQIDLPRKVPEIEGRDVRELRGPEQQWLIAVERTIVMRGADKERAFHIIVAGDRRVVDEARRDFTGVVVRWLAVLGALLVLASGLQVSLGLAPLGLLRRKLEELRDGRSKRLSGRFPSELSGIVDELNRLLASQAQVIARARTNAGKLAHGLKTPLAVLATYARALRERTDIAMADGIEHEIEAMNAHVVRTLAAARAVGPRPPVGARTPLEPLLARIVGVMKRLPRGDQLTWDVTVAPTGLELGIDRRDLEELVGNLLDNARKWAKSRVVVRGERKGDATTITVEDDGPGIPLEHIARVLARGVRLDNSVPGTGIGLAIVGDLIELYRGQFAIARSPLGGVAASARFTAGGTNGTSPHTCEI